jgi:hypothetical protein
MDRRMIGAIVVVAILLLATVWWVMFRGSDDEGLDQVDAYVDLTSEQESFLEDHNFVVVDGSALEYDNFEVAYDDLNEDDVPIIVTTDCMLHQYHVFFDTTLKSIEERQLLNLTERMSRDLMEEAEEQYTLIRDDDGPDHLAERVVAFFAVPVRLADPNATIPAHVEELVEEELALIEGHAGHAESPIFHFDVLPPYSPRDPHMEDYSQYVPRGHYTDSEDLKTYFKIMMWYGRQTFYNKSRTETEMAVLATLALEQAGDPPGSAWDAWDRIYQVSELFVGASDDLMPTEYLPAVTEIFGDGGVYYRNVADGDKLAEFRERVGEMRAPTILSTWSNDDPGYLNRTRGLRIMGQRWIPDSYMFQNLVHDQVPHRYFPTGLEVPAVLGCERAEELVADVEDTYPGHQAQLAKLQGEFAQVTEEEWDSNLYMAWMETLTELHDDFEADKDYPEFMRDPAWATQKVNTHLGSWTELRHDTILYAKQSYTPSEGVVPGREPEERGYVEPIKGFYPRLLELVEDTGDRLVAIGVLDADELGGFEDMAAVVERLDKMVDRELSGDGLTDDDCSWLRNFRSQLARLNWAVGDEDQRTMLVADVHTDNNSITVLEEGVGYLDFLVVKVKDSKGNWRYCVGPVFSYYEFTVPMSDRLTDEAWTDMLEAGDTPDRPSWTAEFLM